MGTEREKMDKGFIKLHRKIIDWEWYDDANTFVLFLHLLFMVNWQDKKWRGDIIKRGEVITSISHLAEDTKLTYKQTRRALENLKSTGEIEIITTNRYSKIRVVNYSKYQDNNIEQGRQKADYNTDEQYDIEEYSNSKGRQKADKGQTKGKQRATTKEYKELKEVKEYVVIGGVRYRANDPNRPLTIEERKELGLV